MNQQSTFAQASQQYLDLSLREQQLTEQLSLMQTELKQIQQNRLALAAQLSLIQQLEQSQAQIKALDEQLLSVKTGSADE